MNRPPFPKRQESRPRTTRLPVLRIRSTGLGHSDGAGSSVSSMRKSPLGSSATPAVGVARDKWSRRFADQCREDLLIGVLPDAVAAGQQQAASSYLDASVKVDVRP